MAHITKRSKLSHGVSSAKATDPIPWQQRGACWNSRDPIFMTPRIGAQTRVMAEVRRKYCDDCPVATECLGFIMARPALERIGIWAGQPFHARSERYES